jgi:transcriptional regulator with XRE-family HTH domain
MNSEIAENAIFTHHSRMARPRNSEIQDVWPKRARFVELLDAKLTTATYAEIAKALKLTSTRSLEHEWRYDRSRRPGRRTLELAAPYLGVELWEIDGPAGDDEFGNIMGILGKNLTPESRAAMIEMARAAQVKGQERLEAEKATVKKK